MSEQDRYIPGVPCWVDTAHPDPEAATAFYGGLFGLEFEDAMPPDAPTRYFMARLPGGDVNPYLALAGLIAAGLNGVERGLALPPACEGNAYTAEDVQHVPRTLRDARELFAASALAREAFGEEVVAHYVNMADVELAAYDAAVTDWERVRGFERL